jgi:hypothetical protein
MSHTVPTPDGAVDSDTGSNGDHSPHSSRQPPVRHPGPALQRSQRTPPSGRHEVASSVRQSSRKTEEPPAAGFQPQRRLDFHQSSQIALDVAEALLRNPPAHNAPPEDHNQWRQDVARLVAAGRGDRLREDDPELGQHRRPPPSQQSQIRQQPPSVARGIHDLRESLNRNKAAEDARLAIERSRERKRNGVDGKGKGLVHVALPPPPPHNPPFAFGCQALTPELRCVAWPPKFRPHLPEKYDGTVDPSEFLQIYSTAIFAAGGADDVMANYFHVALTGSARSWFMSLPEGSISSWENLCSQFIANFAGTCARRGSEADLHAVRQQPDETLRAFVQRFCQVRNTIPRVSAASVIVAFRQGVRDGKMLEKLATRDIGSVEELLRLADKCARAAEGRAWHTPREVQPGMPDQNPSRLDPREKKKSRNPDQATVNTANAGEPYQTPRVEKKPRPEAEEHPRKKWCSIHNSGTHDLAECRTVRNIIERNQKRAEESRRKPQANLQQQTSTEEERERQADFQEAKRTVAVIHSNIGSAATRRAVKLLKRQVSTAVPVPAPAGPLKWVPTPITFDQADLPVNMVGAGEIPLLVAPTIRNVRLRYVLIDGGAGLNILSTYAREELQIGWDEVSPALPFGGIGPGMVVPKGEVTLPVTFGTPDNFRTEHLTFTVADMNLPYNAILGRPALYRFMAAVHYGYLCLKIPGPKGAISVPGDRPDAAAALEKLHSIAANDFQPPSQPAEADQGTPTISRGPLDAPSSSHRIQPIPGSHSPGGPDHQDAVPFRLVQIGAQVSQTSRIGGGLDDK